VQKRLLGKNDDPDLRAYVVWVPRNGAQEKHVDRAVGLVTDSRASQYWDAEGSVIDPYTEMLELTGPCAGIFMVFGRDVTWGDDGPPKANYLEDAHAKQYKRPWPQWDAKRFAEKVAGLGT
jgi:hypothetical protein